MPTHAEKRTLPYRPEQLFDIVADIERYPEFIPWCVACRVAKRQDNVIWGDLMVGFKVFRERFTSKVTLDRPRRIDVEYINGPFRYLKNHWTFIPEQGEATTIDFHIDFEFRSRILRAAATPVFNEAVRRMVAAFESRARVVYGAPEGSPAPVTT
jgi:coenzyme Q-binding protein COQ10